MLTSLRIRSLNARLYDADPSWAFVFPTTILRLPYSLLCGLIWTSVVSVIPHTLVLQFLELNGASEGLNSFSPLREPLAHCPLLCLEYYMGCFSFAAFHPSKHQFCL